MVAITTLIKDKTPGNARFGALMGKPRRSGIGSVGIKDVFSVSMHTVSTVGKDGRPRTKRTTTKVIKHMSVKKSEQVDSTSENRKCI